MRTLRRLDFPAPDGPKMAVSSPELNFPVTFFKISFLSASTRTNRQHFRPQFPIGNKSTKIACYWCRVAKLFLALRESRNKNILPPSTTVKVTDTDYSNDPMAPIGLASLNTKGVDHSKVFHSYSAGACVLWKIILCGFSKESHIIDDFSITN